MAEQRELSVWIDDARVGRVYARRATHVFEYDDSWRQDRGAFPLSYSLPLIQAEHSGQAVTNYLRGLLPDNDTLLREWGRRFGVSHANPLALLANVGHDCAGAVRFLAPDASPERSGRVEWLDAADLCRRVEELVRGRSDGRLAGDEGQFSLAGAQYKTALAYDERRDRWGVPSGREPTTFILKPELEGFEHQVWNEHFCLLLARACGLAAAESRVVDVCGHAVIAVQRYDRVRTAGGIRRVHQEDLCQALAAPPDRKYENEGGPGVPDIMRVLDASASPAEDRERFLRAVIFNLLIGGTDAHAKNYSILWDRGPSLRLAPLYDLNSILPYVRPRGRDYDWQRVRTSMRVGAHYALSTLQARHFDSMAERCAFPPTRLRELVRETAERIVGAAPEVERSLGKEAPGRFIASLRGAIEAHCLEWLRKLGRERAAS